MAISYRARVRAFLAAAAFILALVSYGRAHAAGILFDYTFNAPGTVFEASNPSASWSPYLWLASGAKLAIQGGAGASLQGDLPAGDPWRVRYADTLAVSSDGGAHPQNVFRLFAKYPVKDASLTTYVNRERDNLSNVENRRGYDGESLIARYQGANEYYLATVRDDGLVSIKRVRDGTYTTLATARVFPGVYDAQSNPDLIPLGKWIGMRFETYDTATSTVLSLYTDVNDTGVWTLSARGIDASDARIDSGGLMGVTSDYADVALRSLVIARSATPASVPEAEPLVPSYDAAVLAAKPELYLPMDSVAKGTETDQSGHAFLGTYKGGTPKEVALPNGDLAADFNGTSEYLSVPSSPSFSVSRTGQLTYEAWIRPDTFSFPKASSDGYVDWMGKCANYSPDCEWEARIYGDSTPQGRTDRVSGYVFNPGAGLGSAADWQPAPGVLSSGSWEYVVVEYDTTATPIGCSSAHPGSIRIWVDGVEQDFAAHAPTGCMSQYDVTPVAGNSPLTVGTMAMDTWFPGAVGKVAVYDRLLSQSEIDAHYADMTGKTVAGSCGDTCSL